jgi:hypothetical protein
LNITNYNGKTRIGFSISNLLNTLEHENIVLKQQMALYINYLSFFHISQTKHLKNILQRLKDFDNEIEENVNGNHAYSVDDVEEADSIRKFDYNESDDENPILTNIEPIFDDTSVSVESVSNIMPCTKPEYVNILLIPDVSDNIPPTPLPTPTSVSTNSDTESTS